MKIAKRIVPFLVAGGLLVASTAFAGSDPVLYKLSKYKGYVGEKVKINGRNFGKDGGKVIFDDWTKAEIVSWGKKRIVILVPDVAVTKTHKVRVCKSHDDCSRSQKFFVKRAGPELWRIKNLSDGNNYKGVPGDRLKLTGLNFESQNISVKFGDTKAEITKRTSKSIFVKVPDVQRDETYSVVVTDGTNSSNSQNFYVKL
jgi:hypothetical protein